MLTAAGRFPPPLRSPVGARGRVYLVQLAFCDCFPNAAKNQQNSRAGQRPLCVMPWLWSGEYAGMAKKKKVIQHDAIVTHFAARLRELRRARGFSQAELARQATLTPTYITKLENAGSAPTIDTVARLAVALGVGLTDLLPANAPDDPLAILRQQAHRLADALVDGADRETLLMLCPLLARLAESPARSR